MVDQKKIKALMVEHDLTGKMMAARMGMSDKTFYRKLNSGNFGTVEMNKLVEILDIRDPAEVFFANLVN